ncbi:MAG: diguanylate cyclase domain-containing protein, partial [Fidelibacterota bacterium]
HDGILDLREIDLNSTKPVHLDGKWEFYWDQLLSPSDFQNTDLSGYREYIQVPGVWTKILSKKNHYSSNGFATYRLIILKSADVHSLSLKFGSVSTAYNLFVNGSLIGSVGTVGMTREKSNPAYKPTHFNFSSYGERIEIIIQVSNFHHRVGGIWDPIKIGKDDQIWDESIITLAIQIFLIGGIFIIAVYHLSLYVIRQKFVSPLIFSVFCFLLTIRAFVTGEIFAVQLIDLPWELLVKIEYLTYYCGFPIFAIFIFTLFQDEVELSFIRIIVTVSLFFTLLVIFSPASVYSESIVIYQVFSFLASIHMFYFLLKAAIAGREGAKIFLHGSIVLFVAMVNDILYNNKIIQTAQIISFGVVYFIFCQSMILSKRFFELFHTVDKQRQQLEYHQSDLEEKVKQRTSELQNLNQKLQTISMKDGLTGVANRRRFDEYLNTECKRMSREHNPISLIMCDIDYFKKYNDAYGHQKGDQCLINVATTLEKATNRISDLVGRYGGEEFGIVLPNTPLNGAVNLAKRIKEKIAKRKIPHKDSDVSGFVSLSLGVSCINPGADYDPKLLIEKADIALYEAKRNGRNRVEVELADTDL